MDEKLNYNPNIAIEYNIQETDILLKENNEKKELKKIFWLMMIISLISLFLAGIN